MEEDHHKMRPLTQLETKQYYQDMNSMRASNSMNLDDLNKKYYGVTPLEYYMITEAPKVKIKKEFKDTFKNDEDVKRYIRKAMNQSSKKKDKMLAKLDWLSKEEIKG